MEYQGSSERKMHFQQCRRYRENFEKSVRKNYKKEEKQT